MIYTTYRGYYKVRFSNNKAIIFQENGAVINKVMNRIIPSFYKFSNLTYLVEERLWNTNKPLTNS